MINVNVYKKAPKITNTLKVCRRLEDAAFIPVQCAVRLILILLCSGIFRAKFLRRQTRVAAPAKDVDDRRVLFRDTLGHPRRTPMAVDARGSRRSNALELFAAVVLDLVTLCGLLLQTD